MPKALGGFEGIALVNQVPVRLLGLADRPALGSNDNHLPPVGMNPAPTSVTQTQQAPGQQAPPTPQGFQSPEDLFAPFRIDTGFFDAPKAKRSGALPSGDDVPARRNDGGSAGPVSESFSGRGGSAATPASGGKGNSEAQQTANLLGGQNGATNPKPPKGGNTTLGPSTPVTSGILVVGADAGTQPRVKVFDATTQKEKFSFLAEAGSFRGGIRVAAGDVTGDGVSDIITATGAGGGNKVRVWDGTNAALLRTFTAFSAAQSNGVFVATGDIDGDGVKEIVAGTDAGGAGMLRVSNGLGQTLSSLTMNSDGSGGVRVATGDVNGDGKDDLVAAAGPGALPRVCVFDAVTKREVYNFFAGDPTYRGGLHVATGDIDGDGFDDILTGAAQGRPEVRVFSGVNTMQAGRFLAEAGTFSGGVRVATGDIDQDGRVEVLTATGPGAGVVRAFGQSGQAIGSAWKPLGANFDHGLFLAADIAPGSGVGILSVAEVTVALLTPALSESSSSQSVFRVSRTGSTSSFLAVALAVSGSATSADHDDTAVSAFISFGASYVDVPVAPTQDTLFEGPETVVVTIVAGSGYTVGSPGSAAVVIIDDDAAAPVIPSDGFSGCGCGSDILMDISGGLMSGGDPGLGGGGVGPFDGVVQWNGGDDLASVGFGAWGQSRSWSNDPGLAEPSQYGSGVLVAQLPYLQQDSASTIAVNASSCATRYFDLVSSNYVGRHFLQESLSYDSGTARFTLRDTGGNRLVFFDFSTSLAAAKRGTLEKFIDQAGNETSVVAWASDGKPQEVERSSTVGGTTITESYLYAFLTSGSNSGKVSSVTLRRKVGSGSYATVRSVEYTYYGSSESNGSLGDTKTVITKDSAGTEIDRQYLRWYTSGQSNGYVGGLKYQFGMESYGRLAAAFSDPTTATDSQVDDYADQYLEYDSASKRVTKRVAQGEGCSSCSGGLGSYTFTSTTSGFADGYNSWRSKQVTTLPDGNQEIVYANFAGQAILSVFKDTTTSAEWATFYKYDSNGRLILRANPSAVSGYDETKADLLNNQSGNLQHLRDSAGLVETMTYATSTTATSTTAGDVTGYLKQTGLQRGETGTSVPQSLVQYISRTANSQTIYVSAAQSQYRNSDGTGTQTTTTAYTWRSGTLEAEQITVTLPTVTTAQNGPNAATSSTVAMDVYGRVIWSKDAEGYLSYTEYDQSTGAVVKTITDVDTTQTSTFSNLPSGWSTPSGGGLHLTATMEVDSLGRTTKSTDAAGKISYTVYNESNHEVRVYAGWDTSTNAPTGPTSVSREDRAGSYTESLTMSATPTVSSGRPTGTESISSIQSLSRSYTNSAGQTTHSDAYFYLTGLTYSTSTSLGTENTHFYRTSYGYDARGRQNMVKTPTGTITRTVYDGLGRALTSWIGTNDTGATNADPTGGGASGNNMIKVSESQYDASVVGDGNLTQTTAIPGGGATNRVSTFHHDWRNRTVASKSGVQTTEGTDVQRPISYTEYDNLSAAIVSEMYDGDNVTIADANSDGVPDRPSSSLLRAKSTSSFDELGRAYRTEVFSVDPSSGSVSSNSLKSDSWFDKRGNLSKSAQPGGLVSKSVTDGAGRTTKSYTTDGGSDSGWSDADDVTGDAVLEQSENTYELGGNVILVTNRQRFHDETGTGELGTASTGVKARVSYSAMYYDKADRVTDTVSVGTNGGSAYTRPSSVPARSDTVLVSSQGYDAAGRVETTTDPRGLITKSYYDALGRTTKTIEAYTNGTVTDTTDKTTEFTYNGSGAMTTLKVLLTGGGYQKTEWVYGVSSSTGSDIASNDVLYAVKYPDKSTGNPSSSEQETTKVNGLGEVKESTDRNGNVHAFTRDVLGRLTVDAVTTLGSGVDGAIRRIEIGFDSAGLAYLFTSYDASSGGNVVNQVQRAFNGLGQLTTEYQAVSGAVNTSTSPKVQYAYSEMASAANHSRLTSMTYPNGKVLTSNYATGLNNNISRLSSLSDTTGTLEEYDYLGLGTIVRRGHSQPGVDLTFIKLSGESNSDAGDQYTGLDRFGRVVDQRWLKTSTQVATDRFEYGHDRNGNRLYRENAVDATFSELYHADGASAGYDPTNQLSEFQRGTLSDTNSDSIPDTVTTASRTQVWDHDNLGNFDSQTSDGTAQTRAHNRQNQITSVSGATSPAYDSNGNLTTDEQNRTLKDDAWNRLVEVKQGSTTLVSHGYDALNRRVTENAGTARALYYSAGWQVIEERVSGVAVVQSIFSPVYVDALILRDRDSDSNGSLEERLWVQQDANFNITALLDGTGAVVERFVYDPFGQVSFLTAAWGSRSASLYAWVNLHQGNRFDAASGLYESRARWRSPTLGRWVSVDPMGISAGDLNLYRFVGNAPVVLLDPSGLRAAPPVKGAPPKQIGVFMLGANHKETDQTTSIWKLFNDYEGTQGTTKQIFQNQIGLISGLDPVAFSKLAVQFVRGKIKNAGCDKIPVHVFGYSRGGSFAVYTVYRLNDKAENATAGVKGEIGVDFLGLIDPITEGITFKGPIRNRQLTVSDNVPADSVWVGIARDTKIGPLVPASVSHRGMAVDRIPYARDHLQLGDWEKAEEKGVITDIKAAAKKAGASFK